MNLPRHWMLHQPDSGCTTRHSKKPRWYHSYTQGEALLNGRTDGAPVTVEQVKLNRSSPRLNIHTRFWWSMPQRDNENDDPTSLRVTPSLQKMPAKVTGLPRICPAEAHKKIQRCRGHRHEVRCTCYKHFHFGRSDGMSLTKSKISLPDSLRVLESNHRFRSGRGWRQLQH